MTEAQDSENTLIVLLKCSICKLLVPKVDVRTHTANHFTKTEHICDTCGKSFSENFSLQNHMRLHTGRLCSRGLHVPLMRCIFRRETIYVFLL